MNDSIIIGTSGIKEHALELVEELRSKIKQEAFKSEKVLKDKF